MSARAILVPLKVRTHHITFSKAKNFGASSKDKMFLKDTLIQHDSSVFKQYTNLHVCNGVNSNLVTYHNPPCLRSLT